MGPPPIEAERELIQIIVEVLMADCSLVRSHQPPFEQGDHVVNSRHQFGWSLLLPLQKRDLMPVAFAFQGQVSQPAIRVYDAARLDRISHKGHQVFRRSIYDLPRANPT